MKTIILITLIVFMTGIVNAQELLKPLEAKKLLKAVESGNTLLSTDSMAVEKTAYEVFISHQKWGKRRDKADLFELYKMLELPYLMEMSARVRYQNPPKLAELGHETFKELQDYDIQLALDKIQDFTDSVNYALVRQEIGEEMLSVNEAPWPVSKTLWDNYKLWVTPEDLKILFESAMNRKIFSKYMFYLASHLAVEVYKEGCSTQYQDILVLIEQVRKQEPKLAEKSIKRIQKEIQKNTN